MAAGRIPKVFDPNLLTLEYRNTLINRFNVRSDEIGDCKIWRGAHNSSGYPQAKIRDPITGNLRVMSVHRVLYSILSGNDLGRHNYQVSHLCHTKSCLTFRHLIFEPAAINTQRNECKGAGQCGGHGNDNPDCIFPNT